MEDLQNFKHRKFMIQLQHPKIDESNKVLRKTLTQSNHY